MKIVSLLFNSLFILATPLFLVGQNEVQKARRLDVSLATGLRTFNPGKFQILGDFLELPSNTNLKSQDLEEAFLLNTEKKRIPYYSVLIGLKIGENSDFSEKKLRVGFSYSEFSFGSFGRTSYRRTPYDTIKNSSAGDEILRDSVAFERVEFDFSQKVFTLDISYIYRTSPNERWSPYLGIGIEFGAGLGGSATVRQEDASYITQFNFLSGVNVSNRNYEEETFSTIPTYSLAIYLPVGVNFKLSKTHEIWKRVHLYTEMRPSAKYIISPSGSGKFFILWGYSAFGLRLEI